MTDAEAKLAELRDRIVQRERDTAPRPLNDEERQIVMQTVWEDRSEFAIVSPEDLPPQESE